ncbi:MAG: flagellar biosynthetic protein FliO [Myxococcales bacterium]|nr:flagellar biosynthetic protein FliO [Myxococcales bacterium]
MKRAVIIDLTLTGVITASSATARRSRGNEAESVAAAAAASAAAPVPEAPEPTPAVPRAAPAAAPLVAAAATVAPPPAAPSPPIANTPAGLPTRPSTPLALADTTKAGGNDTAAKLLGGALVIAAAAIFLRMRQKKVLPAKAQSRLRILKRQGVGSKSELLLVEADGREMLLGVTSQNIQLLATFDTSRSDDEGEDAPRTDTSDKSARLQALIQATGIHDEDEPPSAPRRSATPRRAAAPTAAPSTTSARAATRSTREALRDAPRDGDRALEGQVRSLANWGRGQ